MHSNLVQPAHTLTVEGVTVLAYPVAKLGYHLIKFNTKEAPRVGYQRGRNVFGYVSVHLLVRGGRLTTQRVNVFLARGKRVLLAPTTYVPRSR